MLFGHLCYVVASVTFNMNSEYACLLKKCIPDFQKYDQAHKLLKGVIICSQIQVCLKLICEDSLKTDF